MLKSRSLVLNMLRAGHSWMICVISSMVSAQAEDNWQDPEEAGVQCLMRDPHLYLPESITACTVAIATFIGFDPALIHKG